MAAASTAKQNADRVNYLNIGLMVVSCLAAFAFPFELFLFSYAVLGPLHYLTEISWLHDRKYFAHRTPEEAGGPRRYWLAVVGVTLTVMLFGLFAEKVFKQNVSPIWEIGLLYFVFITAGILIFAKRKAIVVTLLVFTALSLFFFSSSRYFALVAFFLITIVHVFVFTGAFILFGALKGRSRSGILSLVVFAACAVSFFVFVPAALGATVGDYIRHSYASFQTLNAQLIKLFSLGTGTTLAEIYDSPAGLVVMRLIAFAYTYHYLNWFSKTSIIKWHEIPRARTAVIAVLWMGSLGIYAYDYTIGMIALYFLSVLHVMLEFPLNHQTFAGIAKELHAISVEFGARLRPAPVRPAGMRRGRRAKTR
ncbi:MAG TPA: hypothetical protein VHT05_01285 [Candidatus Elarobacter sp.]|nr:hypothetical protein [Candidatus Elarobacter sp.]